MSTTKRVEHFPYGGSKFRTVVTLDDQPLNGAATAAGVALAFGELLFDFTDGVASGSGGFDVYVASAFMNITVTDSTSGAPNAADTPDVGLGTVVASGAVATLDGTGTFEDLLTGQTATDCALTYIKASEATANAYTATTMASAKGCYLNVADTWTGVMGAEKLLANGTIIVDWEALPGYFS